MKILHVIDSAGLYGAEMVSLSLMESQKSRGHEPVLLSLGDTGTENKDIETEAKRRGLETHALRFRNGLNLKGTIRILKSCNALKGQIIHSHTYKGNILLGIVPRGLRKVPVIATLHGWTSTNLFTKMGLYKCLDAVAMKNLDAIAVVSSALLEHPIFKFLRIHPVVIKNGMPELDFKKGDFERQFPEIASRCKDKFRILSIGRLSPEKGFDVLIQAVAKTIRQGMNINLAIIGDGKEKFRLAQIIKDHNLFDNVFLLGWQHKAFRFIPSFDLFVLPSYTEGLPITLLEAMQAGACIVATRVGEIPKVLDNGKLGELVPPGNRNALATALERVYTDVENAKQKAAAAQKRVLSQYGIENMTKAYLELYSTVTSSGRN
jgi:glycosyltransferase involved in cell wall biosynthesis